MNGGGICVFIEKGIVIKGDIIIVFFFGNQVVMLDVKGFDVLVVFENGVVFYLELSGGFL